jgi:hypothetical protein
MLTNCCFERRVYCSISSPGRWDSVVDEDKDSFLWIELHALADHVDELSYSQVSWHLNECSICDQRNQARVNDSNANRFLGAT